MSHDLESIELILTAAQNRKWKKNQSFRVSHAQLVRGCDCDAEDTKGIHEFHISSEVMAKIDKCIQSNKGYTFKVDEIEGGSFKSFMKKVKKAFKPAGGIIEKVKKAVPKEALKGALNAAVIAGATYAGQPEAAAKINKLANRGIDLGYKYDFEKPLPSKEQIAEYLATEGVKQAGLYATGKGYGQSDYVGGSIKRRARMAQVLGDTGAIQLSKNKALIATSGGGDKYKEVDLAAAPLVSTTGGRLKMIKGSSEAKAWGEKMKMSRMKGKGFVTI